jgi:hypothetical protein
MKMLVTALGLVSHNATAAAAVVAGTAGAYVYRYDDPLLYVFAAVGVAAAHFWMPAVQWSLAIINALFGIALATSTAHYVVSFSFFSGLPPPAAALLIAAGWMWFFKKALLPLFDAVLGAVLGGVTVWIKAWFEKRGGSND